MSATGVPDNTPEGPSPRIDTPMAADEPNLGELLEIANLQINESPGLAVGGTTIVPNNSPYASHPASSVAPTIIEDDTSKDLLTRLQDLAPEDNKGKASEDDSDGAMKQVHPRDANIGSGSGLSPAGLRATIDDGGGVFERTAWSNEVLEGAINALVRVRNLAVDYAQRRPERSAQEWFQIFLMELLQDTRLRPVVQATENVAAEDNMAAEDNGPAEDAQTNGQG